MESALIKQEKRARKFCFIKFAKEINPCCGGGGGCCFVIFVLLLKETLKKKKKKKKIYITE
jgi:hypothetical protein